MSEQISSPTTPPPGSVVARALGPELDGYGRVEPTDESVLLQHDVLIAENGQCADCGGPLTYEGFTRLLPYWSYRAFSVCRSCGTFQEF